MLNGQCFRGLKHAATLNAGRVPTLSPVLPVLFSPRLAS